MRQIFLIAFAFLASCGQAQNGSGESAPAYDISQTGSDTALPPKAEASKDIDALNVSVPKLAYTYRLGFLLPGNKIAETQQAHAALCAKLGAAQCQLMGMKRSLGDDQTGTATSKFRVATSAAANFQSDLSRTIDQAGGRSIETDIQAEDVSKDMVDAEARIRQRTMLVERLTDILRTRQGKVADLVEAERSVAKAQEELDEAKSWFAELKGRVAMSTFTVTYRAVAPTSAPSGGALSDAVTMSASAFLIGLRTIATVFILLLPWALLLGLVFLAVRWIRHRWFDPGAEG
ncbi:DUF4349 domain-containing protein [Stakelama marina]|uniref:DUF4349 domain-containing protein n=1 Tax=Stakelama marina TaxID=2826939 RepID=A0A8T4IEA1_9SPHN|nr:DUF4349 domain-containing protein [Stakelama marina]MBR0551315.1 DUF4349 domain-containing protein [Stakelama marina]